jgi:hypothetical protein
MDRAGRHGAPGLQCSSAPVLQCTTTLRITLRLRLLLPTAAQLFFFLWRPGAKKFPLTADWSKVDVSVLWVRNASRFYNDFTNNLQMLTHVSLVILF